MMRHFFEIDFLLKIRLSTNHCIEGEFDEFILDNDLADLGEELDFEAEAKGTTRNF